MTSGGGSGDGSVGGEEMSAAASSGIMEHSDLSPKHLYVQSKSM